MSGGGNILGPSCTHADGQAEMLIMSSFKCEETEQTFHVLNISIFYPLWRLWWFLLYSPTHGMGASESLNGTVHFQTWKKFNVSLALHLFWNCQC